MSASEFKQPNPELSDIPVVKPIKGKAQWVQCKYDKTHTDPKTGDQIHDLIVPYLMPGILIFVHGVNSEGEWYRDAAEQFAVGLNTRLGRKDLEQLDYFSDIEQKQDPKKFKRFLRKNKNGTRVRSPVIPFHWGYRLKDESDLTNYPGIYHRSEDQSWGGGPFQNGTNNLWSFWAGGFKRKIHLPFILPDLDLGAHNPEIDRQLQDAPRRGYYIHAAKRLAHLIDTIRTDFPDEPINLVAHSQGNMISLCAMLYLTKRAPDTFISNNAPYSFEEKLTDGLGDAEKGSMRVQNKYARALTFYNIAQIIKKSKTEYEEKGPQEKKCEDAAYSTIPENSTVYAPLYPQDPEWMHHVGGYIEEDGKKIMWNESAYHRDNRGKIVVNFNPADRVVGVSAVEGIGWKGIPAWMLGEHHGVNNLLGGGIEKMPLDNVYQRCFARNSGVKGGTYAVGEKSNYWFKFFDKKTFSETEDQPKRANGSVLIADNNDAANRAKESHPFNKASYQYTLTKAN